MMSEKAAVHLLTPEVVMLKVACRTDQNFFLKTASSAVRMDKWQRWYPLNDGLKVSDPWGLLFLLIPMAITKAAWRACKTASCTLVCSLHQLRNHANFGNTLK